MVTRAELPAEQRPWPDDAAEIYAETEADDRALSHGMLADVVSTWPTGAGAAAK